MSKKAAAVPDQSIFTASDYEEFREIADAVGALYELLKQHNVAELAPAQAVASLLMDRVGEVGSEWRQRFVTKEIE